MVFREERPVKRPGAGRHSDFELGGIRQSPVGSENQSPCAEPAGLSCSWRLEPQDGSAFAFREGLQLHHRPVKHGHNGLGFFQSGGLAQGCRAQDAQVGGGFGLLFSRLPLMPASSAARDGQTEGDKTEQEDKSWSLPHGRLLSPLPSYGKTQVNGKTSITAGNRISRQAKRRWQARPGVSAKLPERGRQESPKSLHRPYMDPFLRRMRVLDRRSEGDHVHPGILLPNDAALQSGMDGLDLRLFAENLAVYPGPSLEKGRLKVRLPAGIAFRLGAPGSGQLGQRLYGLTDSSQRRSQRASAAADALSLGFFAPDNGEVARGLDQASDLRMHADHSMRQSEKKPDQGRLRFNGQGFSR